MRLIAFALGVELSSMGERADLVGYAAGAFATKASAPHEGFYRFIGARQSVSGRIDKALYGDSVYYNVVNRSNFNPLKDSDEYYIQTRYGGPGNWGERILRKSDFAEEQLLAWEWGNPLVGFEDDDSLNLLETALDNPETGSGKDQVLYHDRTFRDKYGRKPEKLDDKYYQLFFVISQAQQFNLCGTQTCIRKNTP